LIVGFGNPGWKYEGTRHNVDFEMIYSISQAEGISMNTALCKYLCGKGHIGNTLVLLSKPKNFMDLSGEFFAPLTTYYKTPLHHVLLMFDEMELPCGILCFNQNGEECDANFQQIQMLMFKVLHIFRSLG
jgi:PTH1 family peptidyl-tRNA hydrolase